MIILLLFSVICCTSQRQTDEGFLLWASCLNRSCWSHLQGWSSVLNVTPGWLMVRGARRTEPNRTFAPPQLFVDAHLRWDGGAGLSESHQSLSPPLQLSLFNKSFRSTQTISRRQNRGQASVMSGLILLLCSLKTRGRRNGTQNQHAHNGALLEPP